MSTSGIIFAAVAGVISVLWILAPLFMKSAQAAGETIMMQKQRERLLVYYDQVLRTIQDLDEDFNMGKLTEDTYAESREQHVQRGIQILQALDEMPEIQVAPQVQLSDEELDARIEAEIASYLTAKTGNA